MKDGEQDLFKSTEEKVNLMRHSALEPIVHPLLVQLLSSIPKAI